MAAKDHGLRFAHIHASLCEADHTSVNKLDIGGVFYIEKGINVAQFDAAA